MWASGRSKVVDITEKENRETIDGEGFREPSSLENEDTVSGFLYDKIQKEVINLRKLCEVKDGNLNTKDEEIKVNHSTSYLYICFLAVLELDEVLGRFL